MSANRFSTNDSPSVVSPALEGDGYAIVENVLNENELEIIRKELAPQLESRAPGKENMMGVSTRRFGRLLAHSTMVQTLLTHPAVLALADAILLPHCVRYQVNYTGVMYLEPGETAQPLHRDTGFYPIQNPAPPLLLSTMWALSDFTASNGATRIVPGSHHWPDGRAPKPEELVVAEMPAGSVLVYVGSTLHGGGANRSNAARYGLALHYALGWLRQEENQYLAVTPEDARKMPRQIQELMGYSLGAAALGFVDHQDPNDFLNQGAANTSGDIYGGLKEADNALRRFKVTTSGVTGRHYYDVSGNDSPAEET